MEYLIFYSFALMAVASSLVVVLQRRAVYSVLGLIVCFGAMAMLFFQLGAQFIGAIQIIVYAGAIMVLFLFVVMLLDPESEMFGENRLRRLVLFSLPLVLLFCGGVATAIWSVSSWGSPPVSAASLAHDTQRIALVLFNKYLLPFELTSVLILVAVIGAVVLAKRPE